MKAAWKYALPVENYQIVRVPANSQVMTVKEQHDTVVLYMLVDQSHTAIQMVDFEVYMLGTGHLMDDTVPAICTYLGTVVMDGGELVWHVWGYGAVIGKAS